MGMKPRKKLPPTSQQFAGEFARLDADITITPLANGLRFRDPEDGDGCVIPHDQLPKLSRLLRKAPDKAGAPRAWEEIAEIVIDMEDAGRGTELEYQL